jgi:gamma-glutamylcyclotransferase
MLYFAYGSNMDSAQMKERCPSSRFVCRAKLPSHRLAFTLRSFSRGCGVADILLDEAKDVWGVVYELPENELEHLDESEDFRPGRPNDQNEYTRENHYVWREGDAKRPLFVSLYRGHPQPNPPLPDCDYKTLIVEGARHWQLPSDYILELESIQTA